VPLSALHCHLFEVLFAVDQDLAAGARAAGCPACGDRLHSARYPRKPRGGPADLSLGYEWRFSFCCAGEGCRRRATPPSVRFLGRRVYLGAVVVLVTALQAGITPMRAQRLRELLGVNVRTLKRWRSWWRTTFVATAFWRAVHGRFVPSVKIETLPASLLERFLSLDQQSRLVHMLRFVCPLTTASVSLASSLAMAAADPQTMRLVMPPARS
jgi:hypothetical protein